MNKKLAKIRPYYKYELADLYKMSRRNLMYWIKENDIEEELEESGYVKNQQIFTLKHTEIIFDYFGHPKAVNEKDIHTGKHVQITPYTKSELADLYGFNIKTLLVQIDSIPDYKVKCKIMDGNFQRDVCIKNTDKKRFKSDEVALIFEYLGHPYL